MPHGACIGFERGINAGVQAPEHPKRIGGEPREQNTSSGRPGRDFSRQNNVHPARCQRIIVSGRTTTRASRQLKNRESNAREIRVTGSIHRGLIPRSL